MPRFLAAIAAVGSVVAAYMISDQPKYRYREFGCAYSLTYLDHRPVDLVGTGGSRMKTSFDAKGLQQLLQERQAGEVTVFNLSHNRRSMELEFILVRDFLSRHPTRNFVIFFEPESGRTKPHDQFPALARLEDLPHILFADQAKPAYRRFTDFMAVVANRFDRWAEAKPRTREVPDGSPYAECHIRDMDPNLDRIAGAGPVIPPGNIDPYDWDPDDVEQSYIVYFMRRIAEAGHEYDANIFFIHLPMRNRPTMGARHAELFEREFGAHLLIMPHDIQHRLAIHGYRDNTHMYKPGRDIYLPWLVEAIDQRCAASGTCL